MKQTKFIFLVAAMVALSVGFSSCSNDDDNPLVGTTWVNEWLDPDDGWLEVGTIIFTTENSGTIQVVWVNPESGEETPNPVHTFTYTFNAPTVTMKLSYEGETFTMIGTVSGSRMTVIDEDGEPQVFTRQ